MPRKGENIYKRKDGRWEGRIRQENLLLGKKSYISVYGKTYTEVKGKMEETKNRRFQKDTSVLDMCRAANVWLEDKGKCWKPSTGATYRHVVEKYIVPCLGRMKVNQIGNRTMEEFASFLKNETPNQLSVNYLSYICAVAIRILSHVKRKYGYGIAVPENPVVKSRKCPIIPPGEYAMSVLEEYLIADSTQDSSLGILIAFYTGIRIGELCALKWEDIDFREGVIHIRKNIQRVQNAGGGDAKTTIIVQAPKTVDSVRIVPIPPVLFPLLEKNRREFSCYVVRGQKHPWADPRTVQYRFKGILEKCGLEYFNFHMLRHAFATRCIAKGFDIKSLSEILGHSDTRLTMNLYVHSTVQQKKKLMNRFDTCLYQEK